MSIEEIRTHGVCFTPKSIFRQTIETVPTPAGVDSSHNNNLLSVVDPLRETVHPGFSDNGNNR